MIKNYINMMLAICLSSLLGILSIIHMYWAFGGRWGYKASIPTVNGVPLFQPGALSCLLVASFLGAAAFLVLMCGHWVSEWAPTPWIHKGMWVLSIIFFMRAIGDFRYVGFFKRVRGTQFADRDTQIYAPLCILISFACLMLPWMGL